MNLIALISGFALGAVCAVALLICLKMAAPAAGPAEKAKTDGPGTIPSPQPQKPEQGWPAPVDEQWKNMFSYDGKPQNREDVKQDGN